VLEVSVHDDEDIARGDAEPEGDSPRKAAVALARWTMAQAYRVPKAGIFDCRRCAVV
jgi:hypothetical protein